MKKKIRFGIHRKGHIVMNDSTPKYFDDDGTEINPDLMPSLIYASLAGMMGSLENKKSCAA